MAKAGVSRWHPSPLEAVERAEAEPSSPYKLRESGPPDRRMDTSRSIPATTNIPPTIAYSYMGRDKPMATAPAPNKIMQIAPIIQTIGYLL